MVMAFRSMQHRYRTLGSLEADVLVIGGGPAGAWAAISAAGRGAEVVLVDKGFCGTSGATAPSGTGVWVTLRKNSNTRFSNA